MAFRSLYYHRRQTGTSGLAKHTHGINVQLWNAGIEMHLLTRTYHLFQKKSRGCYQIQHAQLPRKLGCIN